MSHTDPSLSATERVRGDSATLRVHAIVVMGVSGSGKTTIGRELARQIGARFIDADDLHSHANKAKMAGGTPLTDEDRWPWLEAVGEALQSAHSSDASVVVACSALRRSYRRAIVSAAGREIDFVELSAPGSLIRARLAERSDHFMPAGLLSSQLDTLEPLEPDESGARFENTGDSHALVTSIRNRLTMTEEKTQ